MSSERLTEELKRRIDALDMRLARRNARLFALERSLVKLRKQLKEIHSAGRASPHEDP
jgi:hypothetical protein